MIIPFGKHRGRTVQQLVMQYPDYTVWMLRQKSITERNSALCEELWGLIGQFDDTPFIPRCEGAGCDRTASWISVYGQNVRGRFWCDDCDPYTAGAQPGKLQMIRSYRDAVLHVEAYCNGRKRDLKCLIRLMAAGKGLSLGGSRRVVDV